MFSVAPILPLYDSYIIIEIYHPKAIATCIGDITLTHMDTHPGYNIDMANWFNTILLYRESTSLSTLSDHPASI